MKTFHRHYFKVHLVVVEISQNVFTQFAEFSAKIKRIIQTCNLMCKRSRCYHRANKTQETDMIFKVIPIRGRSTVIIKFPEFVEYPFHLENTPMTP